MSGLTGSVDAAIDLGGPASAAFDPGNFGKLMFGMADIAGNAYGFTSRPTQAEILRARRASVRRSLLAQAANRPMLVINRADDVHVPQADTLVFEGRARTEVHLIPERATARRPGSARSSASSWAGSPGTSGSERLRPSGPAPPWPRIRNE